MTKQKINGAESLVHTLVGHGLKVCFANPGTSEMHFVAALDRIPGIRCIPGLQENIVTGMADGYARVSGEPAVTLLHCGPGLANGLANIHNAKKARVPMVNIVGDQATYHKPFNPPLAQDTQALAKTVSHFVRTSRKAAHVGRDAALAVQAARTSPGQIATLILPSDASWNEGGTVAQPLPAMRPPKTSRDAVRKAANILRKKGNVILLLGGNAVWAAPQIHAAAVQVKTNCRVMAECFNGLHQRGAGRLPLLRVPYPALMAIEALKDVEHIITVCAQAPLGFFAYPGVPSFHHPENAKVHALCDVSQNAEEALAALVDELSAMPVAMPSFARPDIPKGLPSSAGIGKMLAAVMPDNAIVADESISLGGEFLANSFGAAPHDWMMVTGGAIGYGMPCATGSAVAGGGRRVINMQADGSAMYTIQALWTQAREKLPVTTVILSNRKYQILIAEYGNVGANPGPTAMNMLDLGNPDLDFVAMAKGMGVEGSKASTLEDCAALMKQSFKRNGPFLIELEV
jgi:acetolactate synthase I/II/III large subunit